MVERDPVAAVEDLRVGVQLGDAEDGRARHAGLQTTLSVTPGEVPGPAPCLGEHTWSVLESILGVDGDTIAALLVDEVAEITG